MADTKDSQSVELASGVVKTFLMRYNGDTHYIPAVHVEPSNLGGLSTATYISTNDNNATAVTTSASTLYGVDFFSIDNTLNFPYYVMLYDSATAPTPGTTAIKMRLAVVSQSTATETDGGIFSRQWNPGIAFASGIAFAVTTVTGATATADANEAFFNFYYK